MFKFIRERHLAQKELVCTSRVPRCRSELSHVDGVNVLSLDISFRDDLRRTSLWDSSLGLSRPTVHLWGTRKLSSRFEVGSMMLEQSDEEVFVGLCTTWNKHVLQLTPMFPDPLGTAFHKDGGDDPLKHWPS